ncbi:hypothetical protein E2C01_027020 [Portunus trituberculatus]|uniref:Uncharacterized protein n=1 Tax=Portunus trituberculatus TaxID=210409 RepID=A0A5B7EKU4_PORTR|nr:hypothetical protein [Portunus trituberculatus]
MQLSSCHQQPQHPCEAKEATAKSSQQILSSTMAPTSVLLHHALSHRHNNITVAIAYLHQRICEPKEK